MVRKLVCVMLLVVLASCGEPKTTWDDVYKMVDSGELKSKIDEATASLDPLSHPGAVVVKDYLEAVTNGNYDSAWPKIEPNSPFMTAKVSKEELKKSFESTKMVNRYEGGVSITNIEVKKTMAGVRMIKVHFRLKVFDKVRNKYFDLDGAYTVSNLTGNWLIFSSDL